eukprot:gene454-574_t
MPVDVIKHLDDIYFNQNGIRYAPLKLSEIFFNPDLESVKYLWNNYHHIGSQTKTTTSSSSSSIKKDTSKTCFLGHETRLSCLRGSLLSRSSQVILHFWNLMSEQLQNSGTISSSEINNNQVELLDRIGKILGYAHTRDIKCFLQLVNHVYENGSHSLSQKLETIFLRAATPNHIKDLETLELFIKFGGDGKVLFNSREKDLTIIDALHKRFGFFISKPDLWNQISRNIQQTNDIPIIEYYINNPMGELDIVMFLHHNKYDEGFDGDSIDKCLKNGFRQFKEVTQFLLENRTEKPTSSSINIVVSTGNLQLLKLLHEKTNLKCTNFSLQHAKEKNFNEIVQYIEFDNDPTISYEHSEIQMWGKQIKLPRLQSCMADPDVRPLIYQKQQAFPWTEPMLHLKTTLEELLNCKFDFVLINFYRDGRDYIGFHSDREAIDLDCRTIASVSLGATRRFLLRHIKSKEQTEYSLNNGALIVMDGECQKHYKHSVPKELKILQPRINLTFRKRQNLNY